MSLMHGTSGLVIGYLLVLGPMYAVLHRRKALPRPVGRTLGAAFLLMLVIGIGLAAMVDPALEAVGVGHGGVIEWLVGAALSVWLGMVGGRMLASSSGDASVRYRRGAVVMEAARSAPSRTGDPGALTLAGREVTLADEVKHFKFIGTTGTGKSTAIRELLGQALARGDRAIIADPDGGYLERYYDAERGDVILNPFDPRSKQWSLLGEIQNDYDVDLLARSLIPEGTGSDPVWSEYARTFLTAVVQQVVAAGVPDAEVYRLVVKAPREELKVLLADTMAAPFLEDANERMFGSVRSVTSSAIGALRYITQQAGESFSVRRWVREGAPGDGANGKRILFLPYRAAEIAALRSMIAAWLRLGIFEAMSASEADHRLWFVIDELDALGQIDGLKDALPRLRKFGGRCVLGLQSISQVSATYGRGHADTIVENCGNSLILRCSASEQGGTSQFASRLIGQREVIHRTESASRRPGEFFASTTIGEHRSIEPAIMASEIERLADLEGFLKLASSSDWVRVKLMPPAADPGLGARRTGT